jgi:hypothetical protein
MWGAVIGGGISTGAAIIARAMTKPTSKVHQYSELAGLLAGAAAGGAMMAFEGTRRMGLAAIATSFVTNGLRQLEQSLFAPKATAAEAQALTTAAAAAPDQKATFADAAKVMGSGWGGVVMDPTAVIQPYQGNGFGIHTIEPGYVVPANLPSMMNGGGFGAATIEPGYLIPGSASGSSGFGQNRPDLVGPPTLVGAGDYGMGENAGATQTRLLGGPSVSSMGAHFGATLFGGHN